MNHHPRVVFLLVWESKTAGDALRTLLDELAALHEQIELRKKTAQDWQREGDFLTAQRCTDTAEGIRYATLSMEDALLDAFDLWRQYEQQDPDQPG
jgi:hypothetical protein